MVYVCFPFSFDVIRDFKFRSFHQACLTHFSSKLACGVANFGIAHWPSFLRNTADHRRDARRQKYGDERIPRIGEFLERISPLNNAEKISVPLSICHGENDSRVTVEEAIRMYDIVKRQGVHVELVVCEMEGHGKRDVHVEAERCVLNFYRIQAEERYRVYNRCKNPVYPTISLWQARRSTVTSAGVLIHNGKLLLHPLRLGTTYVILLSDRRWKRL